ncbi:VOC family protein [Rhodobacteraceae bacterium]|nr:VOC family protein [Paracoccaceae bacterium]
MTRITGYVAATRRQGHLGVHSADHVNLCVPDLSVAEEFYSSFGLDVREEGSGLGLYTFGNDHRWGSVSEGPHKKLNYLSFGAFEDDIPKFKACLQDNNIKQIDAPAGMESDGVWFRNFEGTLFEIRVAPKTSPSTKSTIDNTSCSPGTMGACNRSQAPRVRPRRLAHILVFTSDVEQAINFYTRIIGLRVSDRSGDGVAFLHGIHGSDHHLIAIAKSSAPGLHHLSWDLNSINEIGMGAMHMADKGHTRGWGLGRHVLGSNYFHYIRDPWGSYSEYSSDIDYIPHDMEWEEVDNPPEDSFYLWGPTPPEDFVHNYESEDG